MEQPTAGIGRRAALRARSPGGRRSLAVAAAAALLLGAGLGRLDATTPDEPRYLQVAEELRSMEQGAESLVLLHLNGRPYIEKPPFYFWWAALFGAPSGRVSELAARLPSALAGVGVVLLTLGLGRRLLGGATGLLGAALLLTVYEFAETSRRIQLDVLLALLETAALVAFWRLDRGAARRPRATLAAMHGAMGLAVLTKGPVGFLVPLLVMASYLAWEGRLRRLGSWLPAWGLALSLGPGLLWLAAATAVAPEGFAAHTVGTNLLGRFFAGTSHARPVYYYLYQLPVDFLPWTLLGPAAAWVGWRRVLGRGADADAESRRAWRFLLAWLGASLVFFSISSGKRGLYLLPAFPAAALLCADATVRALAGRARPPPAYAAGAALLAIALVALGIEAVAAGFLDAPLALDPERAAALRGPLLGAFGVALLAIVGAGLAAWWRLARRGAPSLAFAGVAVGGVYAGLLAAFLLLFPALEPILSLRPLAEAAARATPPGRPIGLVSDETWTGGIAYYGRRPVAVLHSGEDVRRFLDAGGEAMIVQARKAERVEAVAPVEVLARARSGSREALVLRARRPPVGARAESPQGGERTSR